MERVTAADPTALPHREQVEIAVEEEVVVVVAVFMREVVVVVEMAISEAATATLAEDKDTAQYRHRMGALVLAPTRMLVVLLMRHLLPAQQSRIHLRLHRPRHQKHLHLRRHPLQHRHRESLANQCGYSLATGRP